MQTPESRILGRRGCEGLEGAILGAVIGGLIWRYFLEEGADEVALVEGVEVPGNAPA